MGKLTARGIDSRANRKGRYSDGDGLFLRVFGPGRSFWVYRYRINGKERETSIGKHPAMSLAEARSKHAALRAQVLNKIDPLVGRRSPDGALAVSAKPSFGQCAIAYIGAHEGEWRSSKHSRQWHATLSTHCKPILDMAVDEVDTKAVLGVLEPIWAMKPETASRLRARIETVLASAQVKGHIPEDRPNPARWGKWLDQTLANPRKVGKPRGNHKAMPYADLPALMATLMEIAARGGYEATVARALMFTTVTCARSGETFGMPWSEVSFETSTWNIEAKRMKMQKPHSVPLSDQALLILRAQEALRSENPYVFPGERPMRPLSPPSMAVLMRRLKVDGTVHGMRSAARSWMADTAVAFEVAESCLAHIAGNNVVQAYQRSDMLARRRPVMNAWANYICSPKTSVVSLRRA